jgi:hypothetical protein
MIIGFEKTNLSLKICKNVCLRKHKNATFSASCKKIHTGIYRIEGNQKRESDDRSFCRSELQNRYKKTLL